MARSDNVVRVALTPKYRDVPLLCETLTYRMGAPPMVRPVRADASCVRYSPPVEDFEMVDVQVSEWIAERRAKKRRETMREMCVERPRERRVRFVENRVLLAPRLEESQR